MKKCYKSNCSEMATHRVAGEFRTAPKDTPAVAGFNLFVCEGHADVKWEDIITPESWDEIRASFTRQGLAEPKKGPSRVFIEVLRVD